MSEPRADVASSITPFRILTVCTGNICRSPMAERLLQMELDKKYPGQFRIESAGTRALAGKPIDPQISEYVQLFGGSTNHFIARQLTPSILCEQDLVLALTREHRRYIVEMSPSMLRKTFTLREFARIIQDIAFENTAPGAEYIRSALPKALRGRSATSTSPDDDDVTDPYGKNPAVYRLSAQQIAPAVRAIVEAV